MAQQQLPSYQEATARPDWLEFVAPYVFFGDYRALCLVNSRFWHVFAPRLWRDLLGSARLSGLDPSDDIAWWLNFVDNKLAHVRPTIRALVRLLDLRAFAKIAYHFSSDHHGTSLQKSLEKALHFLPNVTSVLLDGHADIEPLSLLQPQLTNANHQKLVFSAADCSLQLPSAFFTTPQLQHVVYLDLSGLPGSVWPLIRSSPLPELRLLKVRRREVDDVSFTALINAYKLRLWSLDVAANGITDGAIQDLVSLCFPSQTLRSESHFQVEGKLVTSTQGSPDYGTFCHVQESPYSQDFSHGERYFADAPAYTRDLREEPCEYQITRLNGCQPIPQDSADAAVAILSDPRESHTLHRFRACQGITHLTLSQNRVTSLGLMRLLRTSNGQLQHVACDSMPLVLLPNTLSHLWPSTARLYGILGGAHFMRPVFSSNLRVLRIHHSLVTHVPTLTMANCSKFSCIYLSETSILPRVRQVYQYPYVPDANPRLYSLTLTCIPRRSSGPLTQALIRFLEQLSIQERAIQEANMMAPSRRGPRVLQGLRHLRLEFDSEDIDDSFSSSIDLDAERLLSSGDTAFSFFDERGAQVSAEHAYSDVNFVEPQEAGNEACSSESNRDSNEFVTYHGEWNGKAFSTPVWIGKPALLQNSVINDYCTLVTKHGFQSGVGPVMPDQVAAGAPRDSYIFHQAWCAAIMPKKLAIPAQSEVSAMHDVVVELKKYRAAGKAKYMSLKQRNSPQPTLLGPPHYFWTGKLEVSMAHVEAR